MSATRLDIEEECLRILSQRDEAVHAVPIPLTTTTVAGDTLSVRALPLGRGTGHANRFDACHVKVAETVGGGPVIGEVAAVDDGGFDNIDKLTTSPAFSAAVQTGTDLFLYPKGLTPEYLIERINSVLRHTEYPFLWIPSLTADSYFEANDLTNWPAVGAVGTRSFITSTYLYGERTLNIIDANTGFGVTGNNFDCRPDETLVVSTYLSVTEGSVKVQLVSSLGTIVKTVPGITNRAWNEVYFTQALVSGNTRIHIRYISEATGTDFLVSPPVIIQSNHRRQYPTPSWLTHKGQILEAFQIIPQFSSTLADIYTAPADLLQAGEPYEMLRVDPWLQPNFMEFSAGSYPVGFLCMRPFAELSTDTATTSAEKDYVAAKTVANILRDRKDNEWTRWASKASRLASIRGYGQREVSIVEKLTC